MSGENAPDPVHRAGKDSHACGHLVLSVRCARVRL